MADNNRKKGNDGEDVAALELVRLGYEILLRNFRVRTGEIDIILKKDNYIIFVEVKYRKNNEVGFPRESVTLKKQRKIINTAKAYIEANQLFYNDFRFDVAEVTKIDGKCFFNYIENAFWEE